MREQWLDDLLTTKHSNYLTTIQLLRSYFTTNLRSLIGYILKYELQTKQFQEQTNKHKIKLKFI